MTESKQITSAVASVIVEEILASFGVIVEEPDTGKIDEVLRATKHSDIPMVSIPYASCNSFVDTEFRENEHPGVSSQASVAPQEHVSPILKLANDGSRSNDETQKSPATNVLMSTEQFNNVERALLEQCSNVDEENMELAYLTCSLSLSMVEAEFLRMQLKLFNLKARSILELFQYCEGSNNGFCRCPEIRKRVYEMGILIQRAGS
ncbi:uncharacterized protein LOC131428604 [Malaya genurostris]|uniref:uncharacterized protein LOC131428604 n=1 Tax=Malaya genurostris TaxID=325434 RepID=UPI0026F3DB02|nr:uncharacterized protein LOC131428604 [Malaya genurostris]